MKRIFVVLVSLALIISASIIPAAAEEIVLPDASAYAGQVDNSSINAAIYLDYSAGIDAGVYKWVLSEDGTYYNLKVCGL